MSLVKPRHLNLYKKYTLQLVKDLGKSITIVLPETSSYCNNCRYDRITNSSNGRYVDGGPSPFANGSICPVCRGSGKISTQQEKIITAICRWVTPSSSDERFERKKFGLDEKGYFKIKASVEYYDDFKSAEYFIFDNERYRLVNVIKRGMKEPIVTVAYLEKENV